MSETHDRIYAAAEARGLHLEIRERPHAHSLHEAADLLGIPPSGIVKTLVVKRSDDTYLFALIPGGRSLSWPKLRALVGVNKLRLPEADLAFAATGYERGTITPSAAQPTGRYSPMKHWWVNASKSGLVHTVSACSSMLTTSFEPMALRSVTSLCPSSISHDMHDD